MEFKNYTLYQKAEDIKRLKFVSDHVSEKNSKQLEILDIGCGNGNISYQLARSGFRVTGIDISEKTIMVANANFGATPGLQFKVLNIEQFNPVESEKYDVIICSEVLEHLTDPGRLVANFLKLLKTDGIAIVTVPNGFGPREMVITKPLLQIVKGESLVSRFALKIKYSLGYKGSTDQSSADHLDHLQFFTMKKLSQLAQNNGFMITRKKSGDFIQNVFPFSFICRHFLFLQKFDCFIADILPLAFTSQFYTVWKQRN